MRDMFQFIKNGLVAILVMLPTLSSADEIKIVNDSTIHIISAEKSDTLNKSADGFFYAEKIDTITKISRVNKLKGKVSVFVNGCRFYLGENYMNTDPFDHIIVVKDTAKVEWGDKVFIIIKVQKQLTALSDSAQSVKNDSIQTVGWLGNEKFKHTAVHILIYIIILCIGIILGSLIRRKVMLKNQSCIENGERKYDLAKLEDVGGTDDISGEKTIAKDDESGESNKTEEPSNDDSTENLENTLEGEKNLNVPETTCNSISDSTEQKIIVPEITKQIKLDEDIIGRLKQLGIKTEDQYGKNINILIRRLIFPKYEDFKKVIECRIGEQEKALAEYFKACLKEHFKIDVSDDYSNYVLIKRSECIGFINEQLGTNYKDVESLKADLNKNAEHVASEEGKLQEGNISNSEDEQESLEEKVEDDGRKADEIDVDVSKETHQTGGVDKLDEEAIRSAVIASLIKGISNEKLEKARESVANEMTGNINECSNVESLSDFLNQLIEEFIKKLSEIQDKIKSQNAQIKEVEGKLQQGEEDRIKVLEKISSVYQEMFGENLNSGEDRIVAAAFENFAGKAKTALQQEKECRSKLIKGIKDAYHEMFGEDLNLENENVAFESYVNKAKDEISRLQNAINEVTASLEKEKQGHSRDVQTLENERKRIKAISKEYVDMVSVTFDEKICESIEYACEDETNDIAKRFMQFVPGNDGYTLEQFKKEFNEILRKEDIDHDEVKTEMKKLFENALDSNSWIHGLARMFLYVQQPEIAKLFEDSEVSTTKITRAFILTELLLRETGITLTYPGLFKDVYDEEKYTLESLSDIDNIIGVKLVKELVDNRGKLLIDIHRVGYKSNEIDIKPVVSSFN